jgi:hypothetical protein
MRAEDYFKNGKVYVWKEGFAVVKAKRPMAGAFAVVKDNDETTVIIDENRVKINDVTEINKGWKLLTLDIVFPFDVMGVTSRISAAMVKANVSILYISVYSRDHFLVKEKDLAKARKALEGLGLTVDVR